MKPVIGITANYDLDTGLFLLKDYYVEAVSNAGGRPVILVPGLDEKIIDSYLEICQGIILSGGGDIDPLYFSQLPEEQLGEINPWRDELEIKIAQKALHSNFPILGICRGCQVLNVAAGGTVLQDIKTGLCHMQKAPRSYPIHDIFIEKPSLLASIINYDSIRVNSFHHQAVQYLGESIMISARAADGIVEAIESNKHSFFMGVQWHPECMKDKFSNLLFSALIQKAKHYEQGRLWQSY